MLEVNAAPSALREFQQAFTAYIRDPQHAPAPDAIPLQRMQLYAALVFGNVERVMANMFPVLKSRLPDCQWHALARQFFRDHDMHDPLFQAMPAEFLRFLESREPHADDPPYLLELAHWEWVDYALSIDATEIDLAGIERDGDMLSGQAVLNPLVWMLNYEFPVHRFRDEAPPAVAPAAPTYLVAYRDTDDMVGYLELNAVTARLLEMIDSAEHATGKDLLHALANELGGDCDAGFVAAGQEMLANLRAREIVLGIKAAEKICE
jgi:hypothetical protein